VINAVAFFTLLSKAHAANQLKSLFRFHAILRYVVVLESSRIF